MIVDTRNIPERILMYIAQQQRQQQQKEEEKEKLHTCTQVIIHPPVPLNSAHWSKQNTPDLVQTPHE